MMAYLQTWPNELYVCAVVIGGAMVLWSAWLLWVGWRRASLWKLQRVIVWTRALRYFLVGLCLLSGALGVLWQIRWLVIAAIVIGIEEFYETTTALFLLRRMERQNEAEDEPFPLLVPGYDDVEEDEDPWLMDCRKQFAEDVF